jgi:BED zinc finger
MDEEIDRNEEGEEMNEEDNQQGDEYEVEQDEENNTRSSTKRSWVWQHFKFEDTVKKAKCNYCKMLISCNKGSTTGLSNHLKSKHNLKKNQEKGQLTLHDVVNNSETIVSDYL